MVLNPFTKTPARIAVIGLGYVGLPLAVAFAAEHEVIGFDRLHTSQFAHAPRMPGTAPPDCVWRGFWRTMGDSPMAV